MNAMQLNTGNKTTLVVLVLLLSSFGAVSQVSFNSYARKQKGVGLVTSDSTFSLNFQFRIQSRALFTTESKEGTPGTYEFRVRRLRFKFEGFVYNPKLTYYIQLSFARGDMDFRGYDLSTSNNSPNVIRDAVIFYNPTPKLKLGFGQTKLPGNRERVNSSGDLQFFDRSIMNSRFNIDRDFGFFAHYTMKHLILRASLTSGEGRNSELSNDGLATTGRIELLPFGPFSSGNDYVEGDLAREKTLKVSIGATYSQNAKAIRQAGQLGNDLYETRTLNSVEVDMLVKVKGWAFLSEYMNRITTDPVTVSETDPLKIRTVYEGYGFNNQLSYVFKNNFEIATRYAMAMPSSSLYDNVDYPALLENQFENYELGVTKYLNGHRLKIQGGVMFTQVTNLRTNTFHDSYWSTVFQIELGI
jgi:hypothetical protein